MKQVAIGRKNWLFLGSVAAGQRMADLLTLVSSALRNDLDVWAYLKDVFDQLLAGSIDYASLRADRWATARTRSTFASTAPTPSTIAATAAPASKDRHQMVLVRAHRRAATRGDR